MGELKIIIWIILGIIYLISRAQKKRPERSSPPVEEPHSSEKPITFEDLLKEIEETKSPKPQPAQEYKSIEIIKNEPEPIENTDYDYRKEDTIYETYEKAKQEAFLRPSMEETLKLENTVVRFGQFKGYEKEVDLGLAKVYAEELRNRANFRKAFIMSEILSRRF